MKPAPFSYAAPRLVADALALMAGGEGTPLAGGQSLVPLMNLRRVRPTLVVDLNRIEELDYIRVGETLRIGAMTRQAMLERSADVAAGWPLLTDAVRMVGHAATRSRGTVGGSVAFADLRAELPVALKALDARFVLASVRGRRTVATVADRQPDELLCEIEVPALPAGARTAFVERRPTHGWMAAAGAAVVVVPGRPDRIALLGGEGDHRHAALVARALEAAAG
jgi:CO/xanthine dehydrogenase FAD-binding subunit